MASFVEERRASYAGFGTRELVVPGTGPMILLLHGFGHSADGWRPVAIVRGREWACASRDRSSVSQGGDKVRWEAGPEALAEDPQVARAVVELAGKIKIRGRRDDGAGPLFGS